MLWVTKVLPIDCFNITVFLSTVVRLTVTQEREYKTALLISIWLRSHNSRQTDDTAVAGQVTGWRMVPWLINFFLPH